MVRELHDCISTVSNNMMHEVSGCRLLDVSAQVRHLWWSLAAVSMVAALRETVATWDSLQSDASLLQQSCWRAMHPEVGLIICLKGCAAEGISSHLAKGSRV